MVFSLFEAKFQRYIFLRSLRSPAGRDLDKNCIPLPPTDPTDPTDPTFPLGVAALIYGARLSKPIRGGEGGFKKGEKKVYQRGLISGGGGITWGTISFKNVQRLLKNFFFFNYGRSGHKRRRGCK